MTAAAKPMHTQCVVMCHAQQKSSVTWTDEQLVKNHERLEREAMRDTAALYRDVWEKVDVAIDYRWPADVVSIFKDVSTEDAEKLMESLEQIDEDCMEECAEPV